MKERPILFSAPMVRALLDGTKTQTRRAVKARKDPDYGCQMTPGEIAGDENPTRLCPYGQPGDRLWVREAWSSHACFDHLAPRDCPKSIHYTADGKIQTGKGRPSIHMPRWASRITLDVVSVRVERLQDISRGDAMAEGCPFPNMAAGDDPRKWFADLWQQINGADSWAINPWVWVVEFKRVPKC